MDSAIRQTQLTASRVIPVDVSRLRTALNAGMLTAVMTALFTVHFSTPSLRTGQVASQTIVATHRVTYVDKVATEAKRQQARQSIQVQYKSNTAFAEQRRRQASAFVARATDVITSAEPSSKKLDMLRSLVPPGLTAGRLQDLLPLNATDLDVVQRASSELLGKAAASHFDQTQARATELNVLANLPAGMPPRRKTAVRAIVDMFLTPTVVPDPDATRAIQDAAAKTVAPVTNTIYPDQVVVRRGDLITPSIAEQLKALGLQSRKTGWQDGVAAVLFSGLIIGLLFWYFSAFQPGVLVNVRLMFLIDACVVVTVLGARILASNHVLLPYFLPVAATTTFAAALIAPEACVALALASALLSGWVVSSSFEVAIYYFATAAAGVLAVRQIKQLKQFIRAGFYVTATAFITSCAFGLLDRVYDLSAIQDYAAAAAFNGFVSSAFALGAFALLSSYFGVTTTLQLLELGQPNQPLLRRLMVKAPGTYNHSLIIANMVEHAAEDIGANSLAAKLGALYHDVGKTTNPHAFVENQLGMSNIHDEIPPEESATIIAGHVQHGLRLARQFRLPRLVFDAIAEHHGTMTISFFLQKARLLHDGEPIDIGHFMYPGPRPRSKETALIMLADGCEAAVRAAHDKSPARIREIVEKIIADRIAQHQLDESPLTIRDLEVTENAFCSVLNSLYHPRIEYPEMERTVVTEERVAHDDEGSTSGRSLAL